MTDELRESPRAPVSQDAEQLVERLRFHVAHPVYTHSADEDAAMREAADLIEALTRVQPSSGVETADPVAPAEPDELREAWQTEWPLGMAVEKKSGSSWHGKIVGYYSTALTPQGIAVESDREVGSVQIYPTKAMSQRKAEPDAPWQFGHPESKKATCSTTSLATSVRPAATAK